MTLCVWPTSREGGGPQVLGGLAGKVPLHLGGREPILGSLETQGRAQTSALGLGGVLCLSVTLTFLSFAPSFLPHNSYENNGHSLCSSNIVNFSPEGSNPGISPLSLSASALCTAASQPRPSPSSASFFASSHHPNAVPSTHTALPL